MSHYIFVRFYRLWICLDIKFYGLLTKFKIMFTVRCNSCFRWILYLLLI